jgi:hypothetical protein
VVEPILSRSAAEPLPLLLIGVTQKM